MPNIQFRVQPGGTLDAGKCKCIEVASEDSETLEKFCVLNSTDKCNFNGVVEVDNWLPGYPGGIWFAWGVGGSHSVLNAYHAYVNAGQFGAQEDVSCGGTGTTVFTVVIRVGSGIMENNPDPNGSVVTTETIKAYCTPCMTDPEACDPPPQ